VSSGFKLVECFMRKLLILGAAMFAATPLLAQPASYDDEPAYEAREDDEDWDEEGMDGPRPALPHPGQIQAMASVMDRLVGAVMDLPIGPIVEAVDPYGRSGYRRGDRLRDMAERDDPYAEERLRAGIRGASRGIGAMSQAIGRMMPVLERSLDEVGREVEAAMAQANIGRPD
jgi:HAMP domain-containing protein